MYNFFIGKSQWLPRWFEKWPDFFHPIYQGNYRFKWLGVVLYTPNSFGGDTFFMAWRRGLINFGKVVDNPDKAE
jgi:hypothetical protein